MRPVHAWHSTPIGFVARWLGSIELAVPVLVLVALAMSWGTYLEAAQNARMAKSVVYGSWWFIALMGLVCVSLIFAVITRFPWNRRHVGFITVHAALVALIVAGFMSLFGRVEGKITLQEGSSLASIETEDEVIEVVEHRGGQFVPVATAPAPRKPGDYAVGGVPVRLLERWDNSKTEFSVENTGTEPYRAVEIAMDGKSKTGIWVGEETNETPADFPGMGITIHVLPSGAQWQAPMPGTGGEPGYAFFDNGVPKGVPVEGREIVPGWTVAKIDRFRAAVSTSQGLMEGGNRENEAIRVTLTDGKGATEVHTAFRRFPEMVLSRATGGTPKSGLRLVVMGATPAPMDMLVVFGTPPALSIGWLGRNGAITRLDHDGAMPWKFEVGGRVFQIFKQIDHAQNVQNIVKAPRAGDSRPVLVMEAGDARESLPLAWKNIIPTTRGGRQVLLRYGPRVVGLPFTLQLDDFRKTDYPGTEMAMAYESDVTVDPGGEGVKATISMNSPLKRDGWKVYQSGFLSEQVSVFSAMRDPGLILTYISCTVLCIGIVITFYARGMSRGHPGIPALFHGKEQPDVAHSDRTGDAVAGNGVGERGPELVGLER